MLSKALGKRRSETMKKGIKISIAALLITAVAATTYAALLNTITINNTCNVVAIGIGVYADSACTIALTDIAWGDIPRSGQKTFNFWISSESGNLDSIYMYWNTTGLPLGFSLTCSVNGNPWDTAPGYRMIAVSQVFSCEFTLTIQNDVTCQGYNWYTHFWATTTPP